MTLTSLSSLFPMLVSAAALLAPMAASARSPIPPEAELAKDFQRRIVLCYQEQDEDLRKACLLTLAEDHASKVEQRSQDAAPQALEGAEMHMVGIYETFETNSPDGGVVSAPVRITVDRPGKEVTLVLSSYDPVHWEISSTPGTDIAEVIIGGYKPERSQATLNGQQTSSRAMRLPYAYKTEGQKFQTFHDAASRAAEVENADSFSGAYRAPKEGFTISAAPGVKTVQQEQSDLLKGALSRDDLPQSIRDEIEKATSSFAPAWSFGEDGFTGVGEDGSPARYAVPLNLPRVSWPMGAAYDEEGQRLWGVTLGGAGYLYEYDIASQKWSARTLEGFDAGGIIHDPRTGYLLLTPGQDGHSGFRLINTKADVLLTLPFRPADFPGLTSLYDPGNGPSPRMTPVATDGTHLLLRASQGMRGDGPSTMDYLVNMLTGNIRLVK